MTEFDKWWERQDQTLDKVIAQRAWHAAQVALLRTIQKPPYIPKVGETIRFLGLCHPNSLGKPCEVIEVAPDILKIHWVGTKRGEDD